MRPKAYGRATGRKRLRIFSVVALALIVLLLVFEVWAVLAPTVLIGAAMLFAARESQHAGRFRRWLSSQPLSFWIMTWFLVTATLAHRDRNILPRPGLVLGLALERIDDHSRKADRNPQGSVWRQRARVRHAWGCCCCCCSPSFPPGIISANGIAIRSYLRLIRGRDDALTLQRRFQGGVHQTWIPELGVVDRCASCHVAMKEASLRNVSTQPFRPHPPIPHSLDEFGCVMCHRGQGAATTVKKRTAAPRRGRSRCCPRAIWNHPAANATWTS